MRLFVRLVASRFVNFSILFLQFVVFVGFCFDRRLSITILFECSPLQNGVLPFPRIKKKSHSCLFVFVFAYAMLSLARMKSVWLAPINRNRSHFAPIRLSEEHRQTVRSLSLLLVRCATRFFAIPRPTVWSCECALCHSCCAEGDPMAFAHSIFAFDIDVSSLLSSLLFFFLAFECHL